MSLPRPPRRLLLLGLLVVLTGAVGVVALLRGWVRPESIERLVDGAGPAALLGYLLAVVVMELLWLPRMTGLFAGGLLFGPWLGGALSIVADLAGAALCFTLARSAGRPWVAELVARRPAAKRVLELLVERRGLAMVALLRVCPVAHYTLVSYAAGLAGVRPGPFMLGTAIGILPGAILYPAVGHAALRPTGWPFIIFTSLVLVALVVTGWAARRMLRAPSPSTHLPATAAPTTEDRGSGGHSSR